MSSVLEIRRGRATSFQLDLKRDGVALPLAGRTVVFSAARLRDRPAIEATLRKVSGETLTISPTIPGRVFFTVTAAESASLNPLVTYFWDVAVTDETGDPIAIEGLEGSLTPLPTVSAVA